MKKVILFALVIFFVLGIFSVANGVLGNKTITITYRNISIYVNGQKKVPTSEPFIYNGSTFVPLRFISEALDKDVTWDGTNNRIDINDKTTSETWKKVIEFTGGDSTATKPFTINSKTWKIVYSATETSVGSGKFKFFVLPAEENPKNVAVVTDYFGNGALSNETYVYEGGKDYFLNIFVANCNYKITVYEQ